MLIFLTGAVILSVEVLASRIMTPYFGVSLYIWAAILSTTLAFLALGYFWGGRVTHIVSQEAVNFYFLGAPIGSAAALATGCLLYPILFPVFLEFDLVIGSFLGSTLLLAGPLVALSAMNPMLVALLSSSSSRGDGGAGRIFFISTTGSVLGVLLTAFALIPYITNFRAILLLSLVLSAAATATVITSSELAVFRKKRLLIAAAGTTLLSLVLLTGQQQYLRIIGSYDSALYTFDVKAEYTSLFGNIKVVEVRPRSLADSPVVAYLQDGLIQNRMTLDGTSVSMYTYVLEDLALSFVPDAKDALVLGLGAGIVAQSLQRHGLNVTVVDINSDSLDAAKAFFNFDPAGIELHWRDARTFVRPCRTSYDIVIVDLFQGDGTPDYLLTREFFRDLERCIRADGAVVMNAFFDTADESPNKRLLATAVAAFEHVYGYRSGSGNGFIVGARHPRLVTRPRDTSEIPLFVQDIVIKTLLSGQLIEKSIITQYAPMTDLHNVAGVVFSGAQMRLRRALAKQYPPHVMIN